MLLVHTCLILVLFIHHGQQEEVKDRQGRPVKRVNDRIDSLNTTIDSIEKKLQNLQENLDSWKGYMLKCLDPPKVLDAVRVLGLNSNGEITATYSCKEGFKNIGGYFVVSSCTDGEWSETDLVCEGCTKLVNGRVLYGGRKQTTTSGYTCQAWTSTYPHDHVRSVEYYFRETTGVAPETMDEVANYCRDTDPNAYLWCYTTSTSKRWDYCSAPAC